MDHLKRDFNFSTTPQTTPTFRDTKPGWQQILEEQQSTCSTMQPTVILFGDSIMNNLHRDTHVMDTHFKHIRVANCGIGGDRTQHLLYRICNYKLPTSVRCVVLHCGTNNIERDDPVNIANGVMLCGLLLRKVNPQLEIVVTGLLPRDLKPDTKKRKKVG